MSQRVSSLSASSYTSFPVAIGDFDLRGDSSPALAPSESILTALGDARCWESYGDVQGEETLRSRVASLVEVDADRIVITSGGSEALAIALLAVADWGERVRVPRPSFPGHEQLSRLFGLEVGFYSAHQLSEVARTSNALIITSPENPTGAVHLGRDLSNNPNQWRIWDLCHASLSGEFQNIIQGIDVSRALIVYSFSKLLRLPGIRVGFIIAGSREVAQQLVKCKLHLSMNTSLLSQAAVETFLGHPDLLSALKERDSYLKSCRDSFSKALSQFPAMQVADSVSGTHIWVHGPAGKPLWATFKALGLVGLSGHVFGATQRHVRFCVAQPQEVIKGAIEALTQISGDEL